MGEQDYYLLTNSFVGEQLLRAPPGSASMRIRYSWLRHWSLCVYYKVRAKNSLEIKKSGPNVFPSIFRESRGV